MKSKKLSEAIIKTFKINGFVLSEPDVLLTQIISLKGLEKNLEVQCLLLIEGRKIDVPKTRLNSRIMYKLLQKKTASKIYYSGQAYRRSGGKVQILLMIN